MGEWGGKIPPPTLENRGWGSEEGKEKQERGKKKGINGSKKWERKKKGKEKERNREEKEEENGTLRVFLNDSFWLGVQAR